MKTIRVTGKGQLKLHPDTSRITMSLEGVCPEYGDALRRSTEETGLLRDLLAGFGFLRSELKTLSFQVDPEYEGVQENGVYSQRFVGYRYRHRLKVEFPSDNERLGKLLYALARCPAKPEFSLSYTVGDPEAAKNALLSRAMADAEEKAALLARAAGAALGRVQSIDYSRGELALEVRPMNRSLSAEGYMAKAAADGSFDMDIEPEEIRAEDTVTVLWELG
jgi:uncharacterized protein YggE